MPTTGRFIVRPSLPQIRKGVFEPAERLFEDRARGGEIEAQPALAAGAELLAGAGEDVGALFATRAATSFGARPVPEKSTQAR